MKWEKDNFFVTDDLSTFNMDFVVQSLQRVWRKGASREKIESAFLKSVSFGLFDVDKQIGFARAVTDKTFVSWICDLYLDPDYRGKGLGSWVMECIENHPDLIQTRFVFSSMPESQKFYESLGYSPMERSYSKLNKNT